MKPKPFRQRQPTPDELTCGLLDFIRNKFYAEKPGDFQKDRRRLLQWVVLWPAQWLDERGVTLTTDRYQKIVQDCLMDSVRFGDTRAIQYIPAWLGKVIQSHFIHHADEIYTEAKAMRTLADQALVSIGRVERRPTVEPLAAASKVLAAGQRKKKLATPQKQLGLF
jgi:hypothetical protein